MADAAAKREARRRRILENSEDRLKKITGKFSDSSPEENLTNSVNYSKSHSENGYIAKKQDSIAESINVDKKHKESKDQVAVNDPIIPNIRSPSSEEYSSDNISNTYPSLISSPKENKKNCDNLSTNTTFTSFDQVSSHISQSLLSSWFFSPLFCVLLAAFVNILILANVDFSLYKGILTPYFILAITRLCLANKSEESQDSMLIAALILCNIKPQIVHTLKSVITFFSTIFKDFALYLTSFILFNWLISFCWVDLSYVKFF